MAEQEHTPGAVKAARMLYDAHNIKSTTMPCFGASTEEYIQDIAGMIDRETGSPDMAETIERQAKQIKALGGMIDQRDSLLQNYENDLANTETQIGRLRRWISESCWEYEADEKQYCRECRQPRRDGHKGWCSSQENIRAVLAESEVKK